MTKQRKKLKVQKKCIAKCGIKLEAYENWLKASKIKTNFSGMIIMIRWNWVKIC